jgi:TIR domain
MQPSWSYQSSRNSLTRTVPDTHRMEPKRNSIFISHASEDKKTFVRPLAHALKRRGLQVWYDEFSLKVGDSLRRSIDQGLAECTAGVVVLSPSFFAKEWPQRELDALYAAEAAGRSRILPIWHEVDLAYIARVSPLMADRYAALSSRGVEQVAAEIAAHFPASALFTGKQLTSVLERFSGGGYFSEEALAAGCSYRFLLMNAFKEEYSEVADKVFDNLAEDALDDLPAELHRWLEQERERLRKEHGIPENAYLTSDEPVGEQQSESFLEAINSWAAGALSLEDSAELVADLDCVELDEYYILVGLPNFSFSSEQRDLVEHALIALGAGVEDGYKEVFRLCEELRRLDEAT